MKLFPISSGLWQHVVKFEDEDIPREGIKKVLIPRENLPNRTIHEIDYKVLLKRKKGSIFNDGLVFTVLDDYRAQEADAQHEQPQPQPQPQPQSKDHGWLGFQ